MRKAAALAAALCAVLALFELVTAWRGHVLLADFRAFSCAGSALLHGVDPYQGASLYSCERETWAQGLYRTAPGVSVPAPLPGYALLAFVPFAVMPYVLSSAAWLLLVSTLSAGCVYALARLLGRSYGAVLPALVPAFAIVALPYGQLAAIEIFALLSMALLLRNGRWNLAACAAVVAAILPHVALPAAAAVFLGYKQMRARLVAAACAIAALDVIAGGPHVAFEYISLVLPAHALSEIGRTSQYGLSWVLYALGAGRHWAILFGHLSYAVMAACGIAAGLVLARRSKDAAYAVLVPPALAMFGGSFIHYTEIAAAIPAAMLLATRARVDLRPVFLASCILLAMPWANALNQPVLAPVFATAAATLAGVFGRLSPRASLYCGLAGALITAAVVFAGNHFGTGVGVHHAAAAHVDSALAQASWGDYVRANWSGSGPVWWIAKAPTWAGLFLLAVGCANAVAKKDFVLRVAIENAPVAS